MPIATPAGDAAAFHTTVDDEQYDELCELAGQTIVYAAVWEDSLADALEQDEDVDEVASLADIDLYLRDNIYFELYGTLCFPDLEAEPLSDLLSIERALRQAQDKGATLHEVAVDEDDGLVLVLGVDNSPVLYLLVGAWILDEWDELPEPYSCDIVPVIIYVDVRHQPYSRRDPAMLPLTAMTASRPTTNLWVASVYAGIATAIGAVVTALLFQAEIPLLYLPAFLLIGVGPVVGYQLATGKLGSDWKSIIGGLLGFILLVLGFLLWPILVGAMTVGQSIGRLFIASLIGIALGVVVFLIIATAIGQDPAWVGFGFTMLWAVWGGSVGAAMVAWGE